MSGVTPLRTPRIKFCGITEPEDAELAISHGAWAVGMILWRHSKRAVTVDRAAELSAVVKRRAEAVGVFVDPTLDEVVRVADAAGLTILQLHGDEGPVFCSEVARRTGCHVIKAARVHGPADIQALHAFRTDFHLLDSYVPGVPGGTGETFAWDLVRKHLGKVPVILSGGLHADNVAEAITVARPFAVDVSSGIEDRADPRRKDPARMAAFARAVAEAVPAPAVDPEPAPATDPEPAPATDPEPAPATAQA
jgi:phosphoribosylanthranilate isomerase